MINKIIPETGYVPQRKGNVLYVESQTDLEQDLSGFSVIKFKRGGDFVFDFSLRPSTDYMAFGDSSAPKPIIRKSNAGQISENNKINDLVFADLDIRGGRRGLSFYSCQNILAQRCHFGENTPDPLSNGIYAKFVTNIKVLQCTASGVNGDVFYGVGVKNAELRLNDFGYVNGAGADNIQFSHENKVAQINSNIIIEDNILRSSPESTSGKGAIAIEGTDNYKVRNNHVEGRYFGITCNGTNGLIDGNIVYGTDKFNKNGFGIGVTMDADNILISNNTVYDSARGFIISASNATAPNIRKNIVFTGNKTAGCLTGLFIDVPYTGSQDGNDFGKRSSDIVIR